MAYAIGVLVMIVGILVSIALHEIGHLVPAKRFGVRVPQYFVGFGPTLWSRTRGETEYGIKAIPLGGYVRLVGMYPPARQGAPAPTSSVGRLIEEAREASNDEVRPGEEHRTIYSLSAPKKAIVMLGGPVMNLIIAFVLMAIVMVGFGQLTTSTQLSSVGQCLITDSSGSTTTAAGSACSADDPVAPAAAAGLQAGDLIVAINDVPTSTWAQVSSEIRQAGTAPLTVTYERDGTRFTTTATPAAVTREVVAEDGSVTTSEVGFLGIVPGYEFQRQSIAAVPGAVADLTWQTAKVVLTLPVQVWDAAQVAVGAKERSDSSVISIVGVGQIAGEVAATDVAGVPGGARIAQLLSLIASLNIALFVFNLIPLVPLDGGHVAGAAYEGARRTWGRITGKPWHGPADTARLVPVSYVVWGLLLLMGLVLIWADIANPIVLG